MTCKVIIELEIEGDPAEAYAAVENALDCGIVQDAVVGVSDIEIKSATAVVPPETELESRAALVEKWHRWFSDNASTYGNGWDLTAQLAYLWPAIISGTTVTVGERSKLLAFLAKSGVGPDSEIFKFIRVIK